MPDDNAILRETLRNVLLLHEHRAEYEGRLGKLGYLSLVGRYEKEIARLWQAVAEVRAVEQPGRRTDPDHPGFVIAELAGSEIFVPFHLIPGLPKPEILQEALELSRQVCFGGPAATICLSGSTLLLGDIQHVGDVDFCEYHPRTRDEAVLKAGFRRLIERSGRTRFLVALRLRPGPEVPFAHMEITNPRGDLSNDAWEAVAEAMKEARNGQACFVAETRFAGVVEVTNWLIFHDGAVESDPIATLSFAFQEAPLGLYAGRSLGLFDSLAAYLRFLVGQVARYSDDEPVKAAKRAIPLLRMFGEAELIEELRGLAADSRAFVCAAALARVELLRRYGTMSDPGLPLARLKTDAEALAKEAAGRDVPFDEIQPLMESMLREFARRLKDTSERPIWSRILAVAQK